MSTVLKRHSWGILQQAKGVCSDRVNSDQIILRTKRREAGPGKRELKALKTKPTQEPLLSLSPLRSDGSRDGQAGAWTS